MKLRIENSSQYNEVLKKIDYLLDKDMLNDRQSDMLKTLLSAVDLYQMKLYKNQLPASIKLVNDFMIAQQIFKN
ncbi:MAG: hypothetical protein ACKOXB_03680 [Flavobacteriales bacterium]